MYELTHFLRNICLPAKIYLALLVVNFCSALFFKHHKLNLILTIAAFVIMIFIGVVLTMFGNYLCNQGYEVVTWIFLFVPLLTLARNLRRIIKS
jgi:hypothetical protein